DIRMNDTQHPELRLAANLDRATIARVYAGARRVHIAPILARECAERLIHELMHEVPWQVHLNSGSRPINLQAAGFEQLSAEERNKFLSAVYANATQGFQYLYNSFPISDYHARGEHRSLYVMRLYEFLNSAPFLDFVREITGARDIALADAQATLYK